VKRIYWGVLKKGQCLQGNVEYYGDYKNTRYNCTPIKDMDTDTMEEIDTKKQKKKKKLLFP
jgi:hypothetical protein